MNGSETELIGEFKELLGLLPLVGITIEWPLFMTLRVKEKVKTPELSSQHQACKHPV